jgi:transcriptional regulator with XRE-family HTH domain
VQNTLPAVQLIFPADQGMLPLISDHAPFPPIDRAFIPMKNPIDAHIGGRIRQRRQLLDMSQSDVAAKIGITFQQLQKYEVGANRVSASRLWDVAEVMKVPVSYFFEGLEANGTQPAADDMALDRDAIALLRAYFALPESQRRPLLALARASAMGEAG